MQIFEIDLTNTPTISTNKFIRPNKGSVQIIVKRRRVSNLMQQIDC